MLKMAFDMWHLIHQQFTEDLPFLSAMSINRSPFIPFYRFSFLLPPREEEQGEEVEEEEEEEEDVFVFAPPRGRMQQGTLRPPQNFFFKTCTSPSPVSLKSGSVLSATEWHWAKQMPE